MLQKLLSRRLINKLRYDYLIINRETSSNLTSLKSRIYNKSKSKFN